MEISNTCHRQTTVHTPSFVNQKYTKQTRALILAAGPWLHRTHKQITGRAPKPPSSALSQAPSSAFLLGPKFYSMLKETSYVSTAGAKHCCRKCPHKGMGKGEDPSSLNDILYLLWGSSLSVCAVPGILPLTRLAVKRNRRAGKK